MFIKEKAARAIDKVGRYFLVVAFIYIGIHVLIMLARMLENGMTFY